METLQELEQGPEMEASGSFWSEHLGGEPLQCPLDYRGKVNSIASEKEFRVHYKPGDLGLVSLKKKGQFFDYLALSLYFYLTEWTGNQAPIISHRLHRRDIGLNGTYHDAVGWFAGDIPFRFIPRVKESISSQVNAFRQTFHSIPLRGVTYEMLMNQNKVPDIHKICPIRLNYQRMDLLYPTLVKTNAYPYESPNHD